ncbi:hypothetical protein DH2020_006853 [Rehmannia glutinosa]|uniref:Nucleolar 27S pre-rRNA processing Urb2/Npa2 C-terminal domain-containing protein n=1 Tax=Rehmannia glutinosa TaxID=99300 RepID=A0ABR0XK28_REHGL
MGDLPQGKTWPRGMTCFYRRPAPRPATRERPGPGYDRFYEKTAPAGVRPAPGQRAVPQHGAVSVPVQYILESTVTSLRAWNFLMETCISSARSRNRDYDEPCREPMSRNKKRKQRSADINEEVREYSKVPRFDKLGTESEEDLSWKNLQLILSLQDKNISLLKKVDLAFDYVKSSNIKEMDDIGRCSQVMDTSRTIVFLNNWVQSVLIYSEKKMRREENEPEFETSGSFLDHRCWKILHFCLEESKTLHLSLTCSKDFLRVIHSVATNASFRVNDTSLCSEGTLSGEQLQFYDIVLDCISLVFSFHGGVANENLDLWILLMDKVLELILKIITDQLEGSKLGNFIVQLSCYLFEPFAKFLRVHPTRKTGFHNFIDKLLEPLLHLLHVLHSSSCGSNSEWRTNLSNLVEEVLSQGLFHPTHIDGFLSLQSTVRYKNSSDATVKDEKLVNKSYHRHLFDKVEKIIDKKNGLALIGLGELLHLFVSCVTKHKGASVSGGGSRQSDFSSSGQVLNNSSQSRTVTSKKIPVCRSIDAELRKSTFDYFVQILEYLLADLNRNIQPDGEVSTLFNVSSTLRSINSLLASCICDKLYVRTEDTSEGARNFLRSTYGIIMSFSAKLAHQKSLSFGSDEKSYRELFVSVRKELIVAVHLLLNIEYEVVGDDLESLWAMVFSSVSCCYSSMDVLGQSLLSSEILSLGCRLIDLYSELRQVDSSIFALCRAARHSLSLVGDGELYTPSDSCSFYSSSLSMLFCSLEFRLSLSNAIKAIPEGQASGFIHQLSSDIMESLEWVKLGHQFAGLVKTENFNQRSCDSLKFHLRAELLGKVLCEAYIIMLDSITVTSGNSYLVGVSLKNLIEIIRPSLSSLVSLQPDCTKEFSISIEGRTLSKSSGCDNESMCWVLVVLLRLVLSCKSLFRQAISLMPPDASKKMSVVIGDSFTPHSGRDWLDMTGSADKGFFSWILQPSATLLEVIHSISDICIQDSVVLCSPLVYVLNVMALQRLVDLNRLIKTSEYMLQWNQTQGQTELKEDAGLSSHHKRIRKWRKCVTKMKKEAVGLTKCIVGFFSSIAEDQIITPSLDGGIDDTLMQGLHHNNALNFAVGSLDEKLLPTALWWIICQNVDIWCLHAAKKDLKNFVTFLIRASLSCINDNDGQFRMQNMNKPGHLKKVTAHQIALEFLSDTISFEQRFVRRYMASRFCRILQKSVSSLFDISGVDFSKSPDWVEIISAVESFSDVQIGGFPWTKPNMVPAESCNKHIDVEFATCQRLLTLLMRMPEEYFSLKSSSLYITYILNLERLLVGSLLGWHNASCSHNPYQIFRLFVTCRRVLQILAVAASKKNVNGSVSPQTSKLREYSFPLPWLLKSLTALIGFQRAMPEDIAVEAKVATFSLLDQTSNLLLTVSRDQFERSISSLVPAGKLDGERQILDRCAEEPDLSECKVQLNPKEDAWQSVLQLAEALKEHLQKNLTTFMDASPDKKVECLAGFQDLNKLSSIIACFQGLLWGLASTLAVKNAVNSNFKIKCSSYNAELMTIIKSCIDTCLSFTTFFVKALFLEDDPTLCMSACGGNALEARESSSGHYDGLTDASNEGCPTEEMIHSDKNSDLRKCSLKRKSCTAIPDLEAFLAEVQQRKLCLKKSLLLQVFRGEDAEAAFFLRQMFIACSAILRLNLQIDLTSISWSIFPIMVDISQFLLMDFSRSEMPNQFAYFWLDGVVKFIEELGSYFPQFDPSLSRDFYVNLIGLHLRVIGKCISLQGKEAKLASQETGSRTKNLAHHVQSCFSWERSRLGQFKERMRMSFITYIKKSSELHLLSSIQVVERALVGVQEGMMTNYEIVCGISDGAVSSVVAAGIDVLDLILEFVTGPRRLNMIKRHIQSLVACLFNVVLHLQGPNIFYGYADSVKACERPDSGSVILMCIEVLTKISGKPSFFQIDACHIAQSLRVPGALFQYFLQLQISEAPIKPAFGTNTSNSAVDRKFSVELYAACCRMLCNALKHHKSETWQCIALLEDSVSVLLHCLEIVNIDHVAEREFFAWEVQEAVKCAGSLRRVYEEVRQQKDVFGRCSFQFLSRYIWVYCGFGPARNGIIREVDEALKPGVYALIDSCSADDLQLLHTVFGEGPCRTSLAALQHDYKINFQFEGKV